MEVAEEVVAPLEFISLNPTVIAADETATASLDEAAAVTVVVSVEAAAAAEAAFDLAAAATLWIPGSAKDPGGRPLLKNPGLGTGLFTRCSP